jgi:hypothetical protein
VQSLQKSKNFHAKTQSRKGTAKLFFAAPLRFRVFACAFDFLFGFDSSALGLLSLIQWAKAYAKFCLTKICFFVNIKHPICGRLPEAA